MVKKYIYCISLILQLTLVSVLSYSDTDSAPIITSSFNDGFTVSWMTEDSDPGSLHYGATTDLGFIAYDDRGSDFFSRLHRVSLKGLMPSSTYYFDTYSGEDIGNNTGQHFSVTTAPIIPLNIDSLLAYGRVVQSDGATPEANIVVTAVIQDADGLGTRGTSAPISCTTGQYGDWYLELSNVRTTTGERFVFSKAGDNLMITATEQFGQTAHIVVDICQCRTLDPLVLREPHEKINSPFERGKIDNNSKDDVYIDFGKAYGVWIWANDASWSCFHSVSSEDICAANLDGDSILDAVIDFGQQYGVWIKYNNSSWRFLIAVSPCKMITADINGDSVDEIVADYGNEGIWIYWAVQGYWSFLHPAPPEIIIQADLNQNNARDLVVDFGPEFGIYILFDGSSWEKLYNVNAARMAAADMDNDGTDELVVDFGSTYGIWVYSRSLARWDCLHLKRSDDIISGDLNANGSKDIIIDFGPSYGLWAKMDNSYWQYLHTVSPEWIECADVDGDGISDIVADFGTQHGVWIWMNNSYWKKIHSVSP